MMIFEAMLMTKKQSKNDLQGLSTVAWGTNTSDRPCPTCRLHFRYNFLIFLFTSFNVFGRLQEQLEMCQKSLTGYLEKKRLMFPRLVPRDVDVKCPPLVHQVLLRVRPSPLGDPWPGVRLSHDPVSLALHLRQHRTGGNPEESHFSSSYIPDQVKFHDQDYNKILSIISVEGELVHLERPVRAEGSVEIWLNALLQVIKD